MRVLVQILRDEERTDSGLYLPAGAKEASDDALYGKVVEVMGLAHKAGLSRIGFVAEPSK